MIGFFMSSSFRFRCAPRSSTPNARPLLMDVSVAGHGHFAGISWTGAHFFRGRLSRLGGAPPLLPLVARSPARPPRARGRAPSRSGPGRAV